MASMLTPRFAAVLVLALAGSAPARAADLDPLLPADTESYLSVNVRQIVDSPLFQKQLLAPLKKMLVESGGETVQGVLKELGVDPFKHIDRVTIASPSSTEADRGLIIVHGTFDTAKFEAKGKDAAKNNSETLKLHAAPLGGGVKATIWEVVLPQQQDSSLFVALPSAKTLILSPGKDYVVDALKHHNAGTPKAALKNKDLAALVEKMDAKQSVSIAVLGKSLGKADNEVVPKALTEAFGKVEALGGGLTVHDDVKLELLLATPDSDAAARMQKAGDKVLKAALVGLSLLGDERKELSLLLEVVKSVKISSRGRVVAVGGRLTQDLLDDFFKKEG
jgi:hypothetical protein